MKLYNIPKYYIVSVRKRAKRKNIPFNLTNEYLNYLFAKQKAKCALSGTDLSLTKEVHTASLDRKSSKKGYVKGNVQWVHKDVNFMKNHFDETYFVETCKKIAGCKA